MSDDGPLPQPGWIERGVASEFPQLELLSAVLPGRGGRTPPEVLERLSALSDGFGGAQALALRTKPIPHAYRVFFRHVGLDPDVQRPPLEALALERLLQGHFPAHGMPQDALTVATLETGIPLWALDAQRIDGPLGIRGARDGETLGGETGGRALAPGRLVVADSAVPVAVLFGDLSPLHWVERETRLLHLFCVSVAGVPPLHVEEAFWIAEQLLEA